MQSEDRIIHFCVEMIHRPLPLKRQELQRLYYELSQTRAAYDNIEMNEAAQAKFHSQRGKAQSLLVFLPDRELLVEEWADIPLSTFTEKLRLAAPMVMKARGVAQIVVHSITVRSTFALTHYEDARVFLLDNACQLAGRVNPFFQRPIATGGVRFVFPETSEHAGVLHLNIESFRHSNNEVFVEVKSVFGRQAVGADNMEPVVTNLNLTRQFISDRVYPFLQQFDTPVSPL